MEDMESHPHHTGDTGLADIVTVDTTGTGHPQELVRLRCQEQAHYHAAILTLEELDWLSCMVMVAEYLMMMNCLNVPHVPPPAQTLMILMLTSYHPGELMVELGSPMYPMTGLPCHTDTCQEDGVCG